MRWILVFVLASLGGAALLSLAQSKRTGKWELLFFHDQNDSSLVLTDFKITSPQRGIASGLLTKKAGNALFGDRQKSIPIVLLTANGGKSWDQIGVKEVADSLYFLNDSIGWLVAPEGIWFTAESGRTWKRVAAIKNLNQVYFLDARHGFAAGDADRALETDDGGATWKPVRWKSGEIPNPLGVVYRVISFSDGLHGFVAGDVPLADSFPPDVPLRMLRARKAVSAFLSTHDGGKTWHRSVSSMYGQLTRVSLGRDKVGLGLLQYSKAYEWPSEVFHLDLPGEKMTPPLYKSKSRAITDVLLNPGADSFIAGYEPPGDIHPSPIPGKVKILVSRGLDEWEEMPVDYRAVARIVWLATPPNGAAPDAVWAATDTGMILKLNTR